ncbi:hypothetical protein [Dongshaea marina]|uniref:hypothetical protein n=1 Tax=Dongshaea marina TaxID=2047966 RepID=UPI000D3EC5AD|nr:hypothetical protein [Dongshaea marina]
MLIETFLFLLLFSKVNVLVSSVVQALFLITVVISYFILTPKTTFRTLLFQFYLISCILIGVAINHASIIFALKNAAYILLLPILRYIIKLDFFEKKIIFLLCITAVAVIWFSLSPSSYVSTDFGGRSRMVGFGVNPNVWGLVCVLLLCNFRSWLAVNFNCGLLLSFLLTISIFLSGSQTAILFLPICFTSKFKWIFSYFILLFLCFIYLYFFEFDIIVSHAPSLIARFDLWKKGFDVFTVNDILFGKGYSYFGAGFSTVDKNDIRIIDSFYISSFISGGVFIFVPVLFYYFIYPLFIGIKNNNVLLVKIVLIFMIANSTGNFIENGFPSNVIYWIMVLSMLNRYTNLIRF